MAVVVRTPVPAHRVKGDYPYAPRDRNDAPLYLYTEVHSAFDVVGRTGEELARMPRGSVTALVDAETVKVLWPDTRVEEWRSVNLVRYEPPPAA
ncbi:hypothetical protein BJF78_19960 [Pseudonocardia sp. CNS-139]|nr:hypothetical protein BJF78_19960 [Pseudonocardia sp. CNS-139]